MPIDWNQIDTVLLDMDGTLLDLHFDYHFWMEAVPHAYAEKEGINLQQAKDRIYQKIHSQTGTLNWYCLDYWSQELDLPIAELKKEFKHQIQAHPETLEFLAFLKDMGKTLIMVTNAHRDSLALKLEMTEIGVYFDKLISSHDFGMPKEDIRIWQEIKNIFPYDPLRTMLIDDNITALKTAEEFGIAYPVCATFVSPKLDKIEPEHFIHFENFRELMKD